jgi:hypothetical protein
MEQLGLVSANPLIEILTLFMYWRWFCHLFGCLEICNPLMFWKYIHVELVGGVDILAHVSFGLGLSVMNCGRINCHRGWVDGDMQDS